MFYNINSHQEALYEGFYWALVGIALGMMLACCTLTFENVSTHGVTDDVADSNPMTEADISPDISIPKL
jgi:hypothetical protein